MKTFVCSLLISIIAVLCPMASLHAQGPEEVVKEMMAKIKEVGSPAPFVDYVNWDKAFEATTDTQREQMKIKSANDMKNTFKQMFEDTKGFFKAQFEEKLKTVPEDQRPAIQANFEKMVAAVEMQQAKMKEQIQKTEYSVGESKLDGQSATVTITQTLDGITRERQVQLTNTGEKWLLDSASIFSNKGQAQQSVASGNKEAPASMEAKEPNSETTEKAAERTTEKVAESK